MVENSFFNQLMNSLTCVILRNQVMLFYKTELDSMMISDMNLIFDALDCVILDA